METSYTVVQLIAETRVGDKSAESRLIGVVKQPLRRIARDLVGTKSAVNRLQIRALARESHRRMVKNPDLQFEDEGAFYAGATTCMLRILRTPAAMRHILLDQAQRKQARSLGVGGREPGAGNELNNVFEVDACLRSHEQRDLRRYRIAELRSFTRMTDDEIGEFLCLSPRTIDHNWKILKCYFRSELSASCLTFIGVKP
jgi:hypothetical protein